MPKLTPYDAFETKKDAQKYANQLRKSKRYPVQYVRVKKTGSKRLKWLVSKGGKNSRFW